MIKIKNVSERRGEIYLEKEDVAEAGLVIMQDGRPEVMDIRQLQRLLQTGRIYFGFDEIDYKLEKTEEEGSVCRIVLLDRSTRMLAQPVYLFDDGATALMFLSCSDIDNIGDANDRSQTGKIVIVSEQREFTEGELRRTANLAKRLGGCCLTNGVVEEKEEAVSN